MSVVQKFKRWRQARIPAFNDEPLKIGIQTRIDAAEYELQSIRRDFSRVRMQTAPTPGQLTEPMNAHVAGN